LPSDFQIGTRAMPVEVCMTTGSRLHGEMFLRPGALAHGGVETVADRLNDGSLFFPLRVTAPQETMLIVGKAHVRYVIAPSAEDDDRVTDGRCSSAQALVTAVMDSEEAFTGVFFVELPPDRIRVLDYVNEPSLAFVPLTHLDKEYLLNRQHILHFKDMST
jgi:hypothetical protein